MCRLQFYRNIQKKSTNPSIRTLVSTLQCRFLCVFRILPYAHSAKAHCFFIREPTSVLMKLQAEMRYDKMKLINQTPSFIHMKQWSIPLALTDRGGQRVMFLKECNIFANFRFFFDLYCH